MLALNHILSKMLQTDQIVPTGKTTDSGYRMCTRTVMDTTIPGITFDENGESNFCHYYDALAKRTVLRNPTILQEEFDKTIEAIKQAGKNKPYDCILGVSGGLDSTYMALLAKRSGLRPLLVHFDNGWNAELAVKNIENITRKLQFDLHTFVMDWEEFRDIQRSYFLSSVVDVEVPTDQFIFAALNKVAYKEGIKYILAGNNVVTESINPDGWVYKNKLDYVNLAAIHKKFGQLPLKKLPRLGLFDRYFYEAICGVQTANLLDLVPYKKAEIKAEVQRELDWKDYGGKHYESIFTRFYQGYYLPVKYNIDKRKSHLSNLILSGQITREEALEELKKPTYPEKQQAADIEYVTKKLGFSKAEWEAIMTSQPRPHKAFDTDQNKSHRMMYTSFRALMFLPVRVMRALKILHTPVKTITSW